MPDVSNFTLRPLSGGRFYFSAGRQLRYAGAPGAPRSRNAALQILSVASSASGTIASTSVLWDRVNRDKAAPSGGIP